MEEIYGALVAITMKRMEKEKETGLKRRTLKLIALTMSIYEKVFWVGK